MGPYYRAPCLVSCHQSGQLDQLIYVITILARPLFEAGGRWALDIYWSIYGIRRLSLYIPGFYTNHPNINTVILVSRLIVYLPVILVITGNQVTRVHVHWLLFITYRVSDVHTCSQLGVFNINIYHIFVRRYPVYRRAKKFHLIIRSSQGNKTKWLVSSGATICIPPGAVSLHLTICLRTINPWIHPAQTTEIRFTRYQTVRPGWLRVNLCQEIPQSVSFVRLSKTHFLPSRPDKLAGHIFQPGSRFGSVFAGRSLPELMVAQLWRPVCFHLPFSTGYLLLFP